MNLSNHKNLLNELGSEVLKWLNFFFIIQFLVSFKRFLIFKRFLAGTLSYLTKVPWYLLHSSERFIIKFLVSFKGS